MRSLEIRRVEILGFEQCQTLRAYVGDERTINLKEVSPSWTKSFQPCDNKDFGFVMIFFNKPIFIN